MEKSQSGAARARALDVEKLITRGLFKALYVAAGYLAGLCALPFEAYPFGIALLAAADRNAVFVYVGLALSCLFGFGDGTGALLFGIYTAELLLRVLVRLTLDYPFKRGSRQSVVELWGSFFGERVAYRVLCAAVCSVALGTCFVIGGGFLYFDVISLVIISAVAPLSVYVFYCFFCKGGIARDIGFLALAAVCVYAALSLKIYGISLAALVGVFITLLSTQRRGIVKGMTVGAVLGLIYSPALIPSFLLAALCVGAFLRLSGTLACFSALFTSVGWAFYVKGLGALDGFFAGTLAACLLYSVLYKLYGKEQGRIDAKTAGKVRCEVLGESELDSIRLSRMNRRMSAISEGLESLSDFFEEMKLRFPKKAELEEICRAAFELSCEGCSEYAACRSRGLVRSQIQGLCERLDKGLRVSRADVDSALSERCPSLPDIIDEINYNSEMRRSAQSASQMLAPDYKALSRLLELGISAEEDEYSIDAEISARICAALEELDAGVSGAMVYGKRKRSVYIKAPEISILEENKSLILDAVSALLPFALDAESVRIGRSADGGSMSVSEAEKFKVGYAHRLLRAREEEEYCGDSLTLFKNGDERFFSLISDGMGSGREAAAVAQICTSFTESMLRLGNMSEELLCMLNGFLCGRSEGSAYECSATFDLMELDLISGETEFFKSGAAPSYVYRDGSLFKLRSCTMPIGILEQTDIKSFKFKLSAGDVVVMMSDGVTAGKDECPWLFDLLRQNIESSGLERTADLILKYAIGHGSQDDISVVVMRIEDA